MSEMASVHSTALVERGPGYWLLDDEEQELEAEDKVKKAEAAGAPEQQVQELAALAQKAKEVKSQDRRDLLGFPLPDLTITGAMTELIMAGPDKLSQKKSPTIHLYAGSDPDTVILVSDDEYLSEIEVWDLESKARVFYKRGAFSKVAVAEGGAEFAVATPSALGRFAVSRVPGLAVTERDIWSPARGPERLGEPVGIWLSPRSHFLASAHSPALKMEGPSLFGIQRESIRETATLIGASDSTRPSPR
jgi:hypothetical protein